MTSDVDSTQRIAPMPNDLDDILDSVFASLGPTGRTGAPLAAQNPLADITRTRNALTGTVAETLGLPDAMRALRGEMTPDEAQHFAATAALGLLPGGKMESTLLRGAGKLGDISERGIAKALAKNPGASIFDVAGASTKPGGYIGAVNPQMEVFHLPEEQFPREVPFEPNERARALGFSTPAVHGTKMVDPDSGEAFDAFKLPENELGVHFGSPRAAQHFAGNVLGERRPDWQGGKEGDTYLPRAYPTVLKTGKSITMPDLGTWQIEDVAEQLAKKFPKDEDSLLRMQDIKDVRSYLADKGYDSVKYTNEHEDPGHTSYILFKPSPVAPDYVAGARSPFAQFNPNKISWPELTVGVGGLSAGSAATGLYFDEDGNPKVRTQ